MAYVAKVHGELRGQWTRGKLGQRQAFSVLVLGDPPTPLDEVTTHVSHERNRAAEAQRAETQGVKR
jgi:hypothetical protein